MEKVEMKSLFAETAAFLVEKYGKELVLQPTTPKPVIEMLAGSADVEIRKAAARHIGKALIKCNMLAKLAKDESA